MMAGSKLDNPEIVRNLTANELSEMIYPMVINFFFTKKKINYYILVST